MIVLVGASASGKTEVAKLLAKKYHITKVITTTTREKRTGERNGVDYFFVSKEEFQQMVKDNRFIETTVYNNNYYGSTKDQIADQKCVVIDPVGAKSFINLHDPRIITFYLESDREKRYQRMIERGDDILKIKSRIKNDDVAFAKDNLPLLDVTINSDLYHIEELTDLVYQKYCELLNTLK